MSNENSEIPSPYADTGYYFNTFCGINMPLDEAERLLRAASDIVDAIVTKPITEVTERVRRAVCYEVELLCRQGGYDALCGLVPAAGVDADFDGMTISVGDGIRTPTFGGIPVSPVTVGLLRSDGLCSRIVYDGGAR